MLVGGETTRKGPQAAGTRRGQPRSSRWATHGGAGPLPRKRGARVRRDRLERAGL
jgi:hypothetical protein